MHITNQKGQKNESSELGCRAVKHEAISSTCRGKPGATVLYKHWMEAFLVKVV